MFRAFSTCVFVVLALCQDIVVEAQALPTVTPGSREGAILRALAEETVLHYNESPLSDVVREIGQAHRIPVRLDVRALDDVGLGQDTSVTVNVSARLDSALTLLLRDTDRDLTWQVEDGYLVITTYEAAEERLQTRIYDVKRIVEPGDYGPDYDALIDLLTSTVAPDSWEDVGGPGSVAPFDTRTISALVISQTYQIHRQVEGLLVSLHRAGGHTVPASHRVRLVHAADDGAVMSLQQTAMQPTAWNPRSLPMTKARHAASHSSARTRRRVVMSRNQPLIVSHE